MNRSPIKVSNEAAIAVFADEAITFLTPIPTPNTLTAVRLKRSMTRKLKKRRICMMMSSNVCGVAKDAMNARMTVPVCIK